MKKCDFLIIGSGIIGLTIAVALKNNRPAASVLIIDKEDGEARHASGRNSGVLHAGFYYTADSLKARFTRDGNQRLSAYCRERNLTLNACGKLVVAQDQSQLAGLDELLHRGAVNGVPLRSISADDACTIEPRVRTW